ncbi:MAG: transposase [Candidatus Liptonbacteria bacterium]|nr:transposase [Candidatus Liptonbacteria bacterium]
MIRPKPATNEIYHIYNRGVEKRDIFKNDADRLRFVHDLFEFNDTASAENIYYRDLQSYEVGLRKIVPKNKRRGPRSFLVEVLVFCLMPNHFHLMIRQRVDNGITEFMRKLGTGYTNYFNQKYERVGALFQGKYKAIRLARDEHFIHLPYYIHLNPLDIVAPEWRTRELKNYRRAAEFLRTYRWSSYPDYLGRKNFPSVTQREFLIEFFGGPKEYEKLIFGWLKEIDLDEVKDIALE